jgi:hypothetical protein
VQRVIERSIQTPIRSHPHIALEELEGEEVTVRIEATPVRASDGPQLADEILAAVAGLTARNGSQSGHKVKSAGG